MRKGVIVSLLVSALWSGAWAQTQRQFSVWESGVQSDYQIVNMDSLTFHADGSMLIYAMDGNDTMAAKDVDSVTFRYPEFVSTNLRDAETIRQDFDYVTITVPVYSKPEDVVNLLYLVASDELSIRSWSFF